MLHQSVSNGVHSGANNPASPGDAHPTPWSSRMQEQIRALTNDTGRRRSLIDILDEAISLEDSHTRQGQVNRSHTRSTKPEGRGEKYQSDCSQ